MGDFTPQEVDSLLAQHTTETGQAFTDEAQRSVRELTQGQPWLVNALAYEACFRSKAGRDRSRPITADAVQDAREQLILRRDTHLDQLTDKLQEERVRRVIEPLLSGAEAAESIHADDLQRIVNSGGRIEREYGLGRMRTDLLIVWPSPGGAGLTQRVVIECKVLHRGLDRTLRDGLEQTRAYMDRCAAAEGHLVIFDRRSGTPWERKLYRRVETEGGAPVTVWGM